MSTGRVHGHQISIAAKEDIIKLKIKEVSMNPSRRHLLTEDWVYDSLLLMSVMKADDVMEYAKPRRFGFYNANFRGFFC